MRHTLIVLLFTFTTLAKARQNPILLNNLTLIDGTATSADNYTDGNEQITYIPTLSLDEFAFAYGDDPDWINDPHFRTSLEPGVYDMITSPAYKEKTNKSSQAAQEETALPIALKNLLTIYRAGIPIALGTDAGAHLLKIDADQGTLEKGKKADFIVLDKDPLVDIHNTLTISAVWKDGVKVSDGPTIH